MAVLFWGQVAFPVIIQCMEQTKDVGEAAELPEQEVLDVAPENVETQEVPPQLVGEYTHVYSTWEMLARNPSVKEGVKALARTMANLGITTLDAFPIAEGGSITADAIKMLAKLKWLKKLDFLTPHVSLKGAIVTELADVGTLGVAPTHAYETLHQFFGHDKKALRDAYVAIRETLRFCKEGDTRNHAVLQEAVAAFMPEDKQTDI